MQSDLRGTEFIYVCVCAGVRDLEIGQIVF